MVAPAACSGGVNKGLGARVLARELRLGLVSFRKPLSVCARREWSKRWSGRAGGQCCLSTDLGDDWLKAKTWAVSQTCLSSRSEGCFLVCDPGQVSFSLWALCFLSTEGGD